MEGQPKLPALDYDNFLEIIKRRRSVRRFEKGKKVERETLMKIAEAGRWAPTGANAQCWDLVIVDEPETRQGVLDVFLRQSQRLVDHAKGFPAGQENLSRQHGCDLRYSWRRAVQGLFSTGHDGGMGARNEANNERIFLASLGAAIQNIQLAVTACGLTSAWLSGGGEDKTNEELAALLGYPPFLSAIGTVPIGYPEKDVSRRYRRPLKQIVHWNHYETQKLRPDAMIEHYVSEVRPFAMYRGVENVSEWEDADDILGRWTDFSHNFRDSDR